MYIFMLLFVHLFMLLFVQLFKLYVLHFNMYLILFKYISKLPSMCCLYALMDVNYLNRYVCPPCMKCIIQSL